MAGGERPAAWAAAAAPATTSKGAFGGRGLCPVAATGWAAVAAGWAAVAATGVTGFGGGP